MCWYLTSVLFLACTLHLEGLPPSKSPYIGQVSCILKIIYSVLLLVLLAVLKLLSNLVIIPTMVCLCQVYVCLFPDKLCPLAWVIFSPWN